MSKTEAKARVLTLLVAAVALIAIAAGLVAGCSLFGGGKPAEDEPPVFAGFALIDAGTLQDPVVRAWAQACGLSAGVHLASFDGANTYILAARGEKPTGGFTVFLSDVSTETGGFHLTFKTGDPSGPVTQIISYPYALYLGQCSPGQILDVSGVGAETLPWPVAGPANVNIIPTSPLPGVAVSTTTLHLEGYARVFEAQFSYSLEDGHNVLAAGSIMADQGAPAWGLFSLDVEFSRPTSPGLTLSLFDMSMKDGSIIDEVFIPLVWTGN